MKGSFLFLCLLFFGSQCLAQLPANLDEYPVLQIAKETSLYKANVDWDVVCKEYIQLAKHSEDSYEKLTYLLNATGDSHGTFRSASDYRILAHFTAWDQLEERDERPSNSKFHNEVINNPNARFEFKRIGGDTGYLKVVGIGPQNPVIEDARTILGGITVLKEQGVDKWILDLRYNGGGNMNPMLAGLAPLLGDGKIGGSIDGDKEVLQTYEIKNGQFYDSGRLVADLENKLKSPSQEKVAVLTSRYTASSGELVAVAFKGRPGTVFFGEKTSGLTSVTGFDRINEDMIMLISKAFYTDRNGKVYEHGVEVDRKIVFEEYAEEENDQILLQSLEWLQK